MDGIHIQVYSFDSEVVQSDINSEVAYLKCYNWWTFRLCFQKLSESRTGIQKQTSLRKLEFMCDFEKENELVI